MSKGYPVLRIDALYASPLHRNMGVGRKLMQHAIDLANKATRLQLFHCFWDMRSCFQSI
ncbi:GNAT family N-acetyltransferase [Paenibacillus sp. V4I3]|uniref:GNAT family N-acetyltransferase n=1 Tax=Paenibacillus sp. V4I3 TaxID=3042305 RepID=UPI0027D8655F|nr:GNAT family N-acetyltransferase [Paenibacillus sp. V4I3]